MSTGDSTVGFIRDIFSAADKLRLQLCQNYLVGKGHVPQAMPGTSSSAVHGSEHVNPKNRFILLLRLLLRKLKRSVPRHLSQ